MQPTPLSFSINWPLHSAVFRHRLPIPAFVYKD
jgi:hypothetical protein